jgi:hypothetical protein
MRIQPRRIFPALLVAALTIAGTTRLARADAWQVTEFTSPAGKAAHGIAVESSGAPRARLLIGCESADKGWRGVAVWHAVKDKPTNADAEVVVSFFGRSPVTERWAQRAEGAEGALLSPASGEALRRNLLREDTTRGQASVTIEVRDKGSDPVRLVFALDGLTARSADLAAACGGWGGATPYSKRRERRW